MAPLSAVRYALQATIGRSAYDDLQYAQALLGHQVPPGEIAPVLERALKALVRELEKRKFAATSRPRRRRPHSSAGPRHIPAAVKRLVWERDGGQCTFVSEGGRRCAAQSRLEFDHANPVACGGEATVGGLRLRCRAHNQYAAECAFGSDFMSHKRREAQRARAVAKARTARPVDPLAPGPVEPSAARRMRPSAPARVEAPAQAGQLSARMVQVEQSDDRDVVPWLRQLGFRVDEARRAAERCDAFPGCASRSRS